MATQKKAQKPKKPAPKNNNAQLFRNFILLIVILLVAGFAYQWVKDPDQAAKEVALRELVQHIESGEVKQIEISGEQTMEATLVDDSKIRTRKEAGQPLTELLAQQGVKPETIRDLNVTVTSNSGFGYWASLLWPGLITVIFIGALLWFMLRQVQGANNRALMFGRSGAQERDPKDKKNRVTFADVAGAKNAKEELEEVVDFLKYPQKYAELGAKVPRGVLLVGPPGTGKTLMARAVAGEANVPFYHISGSEFVEMFVGVGASRVRDLFKKAKQNAPAIVFVDEIDAVGRQRGTGLGGSHDEREQTLNQILVEMDGFDNDTQIIVIAATNRPDVLDPALLRPGRFDRHVMLDLPDIKERMEILKVHAKNKPLTAEVKLEAVAQRTPGFSGADLANILNEAAILAARENKKEINMQNCFSAIEKVMLGPEKKDAVIDEEEKKITAYHEGGHALVAYYSKASDPVHKISIISRGRTGGYTLKLPERDKHLHKRAEFLADLAVMLGGRTAEELIFKEVTTGASNDLENATKLARSLVTQYGMSEELGPRTFGHREETVFLGRELAEHRDYSDNTALKIDEAVDTLIAKAHQMAEHVLSQHTKELDRLAGVLMEKETIEREEFEALMAQPV